MHPNPRTITVTLNWTYNGERRQSTIICDDSAPKALIPMLATSCGLPPGRYGLRVHSPEQHILHDDLPISAQGVNDGTYLWLTDGDLPKATQQRCLIELTGNVTLFAPPTGVSLTRTWLLRVLELLDPPAYRHEVGQLEQRASPYRFVSNREHCLLRRDQSGGWSVISSHHDLVTRLNNRPLIANRPAPVPEHARLQLGEQGPELRLHLIPMLILPADAS